MKKIFFIIFLILNVSYLAQPTSNFNTPNIDGTSKKYFSIYDKTAWLWFNPVNRKMGLIDVSVFPKDTTYFGLDTAKSYILTGTWDFRKKVKIDSLEFTWNSGTSRDSTGYFKLPKLGKSLYPILQVGRFGFIDGGADLYYRTTPVVSSGYGNVDTLMSKYYFDRHKGLDTSKAYILTNNWYFNGIAKKVYFGSGHYLQLPGFSDGITEREIYYDALVHKIGVITNTGSKWLAYEESLIDSTKISYLAKTETYTGAKTFTGTVNLNSTTTLGVANKFDASNGYFIVPGAGGTNANALYYDGVDLRFQTYPGNFILAKSTDLVNYFLKSDTTKLGYLAKTNVWTGASNTFRNGVNFGVGSATYGVAYFYNAGNSYYTSLSAINTTTSDKVIYLPNASGNIPLLSTSNIWTGTNKFSNTVQIDSSMYFTKISATSTALSASKKGYIQLGGSPGTYNLQTISGGTTGQTLILEGSSTTWTVKNYVSGSDNIRLAGSTDFAMGTYDTLVLLYNGSYWVELSRSNN